MRRLSPPIVPPSTVPSPQPSVQPLDIPSPIATHPPITKAPINRQPQRVPTEPIWSQASFPVENFQAYTSGFGWRAQEEGEEFHTGLDIAAPQGSYVRNWWSGKVIKVAEDNRCGTHLVIQSGNWQAVYCHLEGQVNVSSDQKNSLSVPDSNIIVVQGQWVPTGAPIARVGITGRTTGPHLHWGLRYAGQWVDPAIALRKMYAAYTQKNVSAQRKPNQS